MKSFKNWLITFVWPLIRAFKNWLIDTTLVWTMVGLFFIISYQLALTPATLPSRPIEDPEIEAIT